MHPPSSLTDGYCCCNSRRASATSKKLCIRCDGCCCWGNEADKNEDNIPSSLHILNITQKQSARVIVNGRSFSALIAALVEQPPIMGLLYLINDPWLWIPQYSFSRLTQHSIQSTTMTVGLYQTRTPTRYLLNRTPPLTN